MSENLHPGYEVIKGLDGDYYPVLVVGGAKSTNTDSKGRHLDLSHPSHFGYNMERDVWVFVGDNGRNDIISFPNEPHAHNFLNKWVREEVGLGVALETWNAHIRPTTRKIEVKHVHANLPAEEPSDLHDLHSRLVAIKAAAEIAETLVRQAAGGTLDRVQVQTMLLTLATVSESAETVEFFSTIAGEIA